MAALHPCDRIRIGVKLGYLPKAEGTQCPHTCKKTLKLRQASRDGPEFTICRQKFHLPRACRYYCPTGGCGGNSNGIPVECDRGEDGLSLGGRGRAPAGEGLLCICLATQPWASGHPSPSDCCLIMGISLHSMQLCLDAARRQMAKLNIVEQRSIKFKEGDLTEWDECGIRCERIRCTHPCTQCGDECSGYRLLWSRWIIGVARGDRTRMVLEQLPWETSTASGGGVPLSQQECDAVCPKYLTRGMTCLTDGASAYEAFAAGSVACSPACVRKDWLKRATECWTDCLLWVATTMRSRICQCHVQKVAIVTWRCVASPRGVEHHQASGSKRCCRSTPSH
jgi:hypothetical protein